MAPSTITTTGLLRLVRGVAIISPWLFHLFLADIALSGLLPVSFVAPVAAYRASSSLALSVWSALQRIFLRRNAARVTVSGDPLPQGESAVVVANHIGWTDVYMIQALAERAGMLGYCRWFAKNSLKWVPFLGWGLWAMGMPLVSRNWLRDSSEIQQVFANLVKYRLPVWLVSYSEGTRYTAQKHAEAVAWCKERDKPLPVHTLHPRTKGFVATVEHLRKASHVKAVYDVTVAYAKDQSFHIAPPFWDTISTPDLHKKWRFHVHVDRFPIDDLPHGEQALAQWLEDRWVEKDRTLEDLRKRLTQGESWGDQFE